jgi:pimeloyl-ACP methyl ester carboxylesterase
MIRNELLTTARGEFEALVDGPDDAPVVLLLHGFPQLNETWRQYLPALASAGFRVIAPNQRGYGRSVRHGSFALRDLVVDAVAMLDTAGVERAAVVGHDWGGAVTWGLAGRYPERVSAVVTLNSPPPPVLREQIRRSARQRLRSSYMLVFQVPHVPERVLAGRIPRLLRLASHRRHVWTPSALQPYAHAFASPDDLTGPLSWYRGMRAPAVSPDGRRSQPISAPVLVIWGTEDSVLSIDLASVPSLRPVLAPGNDPQIVHIPGAGHFVQDEAPEEVRRVLLDWLVVHARPTHSPDRQGVRDSGQDS